MMFESLTDVSRAPDNNFWIFGLQNKHYFLENIPGDGRLSHLMILP